MSSWNQQQTESDIRDVTFTKIRYELLLKHWKMFPMSWTDLVMWLSTVWIVGAGSWIYISWILSSWILWCMISGYLCWCYVSTRNTVIAVWIVWTCSWINSGWVSENLHKKKRKQQQESNYWISWFK